MAIDPCEVDRLEQNASEVHRLVQSTRNNFAPVNRIPPELFLLIPQYWSDDCRDQSLIAMTHVCQGWRETLTGYPFLWTRLDFLDCGKTSVYIERSKSSPLKLSLREDGTPRHRVDALLLVVPHIGRIDTLTIKGGKSLLQTLTTYFSCPTPLLRFLSIELECTPPLPLSAGLFNGDLSSLCKLSLAGVIPHLPWQQLPKLTTFKLQDVPGDYISVTSLLDFFTNAPLLNKVELFSMPEKYDASPGRIVTLPCLENLVISAGRNNPSRLLNHLCVPAGASLRLRLDPAESPLPEVLTNSPENLHNIRFVTSAYLRFAMSNFSVQLNGPSGELHMECTRAASSYLSAATALDRSSLQSLDYFDLSQIQRLVVSTYEYATDQINTSPPSHILNMMKDLRTLFLNRGNSRPFFVSLDPGKNPSKRVLCPKLEHLIIYTTLEVLFNIPELINMAKERASNGAKLHSITLASKNVDFCEEDLLELQKHVIHFECRTCESVPEWDSILDGGSD
ncbi:hypothetical protein BJ322DRAFT_284970 [Thelephora terrestris]|uniref:F-box domain-containing protein n=1 Tax=Thelephora terrestris TaxID=56493 RepID=A0A9P6L2T5_9AGAM|nr:hypothetical protein BJ322DRAFT_284970 [Thelephora terrestris]